MRDQLETAIECLKQEGAIAKLHEKWFGIAPAAGSAAVTVFPGNGVPDMQGYDPAPRTLEVRLSPVIPGHAEGVSPEPTALADAGRRNTPSHGFRARRCAAPRNDS